MDKIILEKLLFKPKNTPKAPKIRGKFSETLWNMRNSNEVFRAHDKIILEHLKIRLYLQKSENGS